MKKVISIICVVAMLVTLVSTMGITIHAGNTFSYRDVVYNVPDDPTSGLSKTETKWASDVEYINGGMKYIYSGWYYVDGNVGFDSFTICGDVKFILGGGCSLSGKYIKVPQGNSLTVYIGDESNPGTVTLNANKEDTIYAYDDMACIGGEENGSSGPITLNGGKYFMTLSHYGAGVGGGKNGDGSNIILNNCTFEFKNNENKSSSSKGKAALIGGGQGGSGHNICVNNCTITALSKAGFKGGIGGGDNGSCSNLYINHSDITIELCDYGTGNGQYARNAAIGSGSDHDANHIVIKTSVIKVQGAWEGGAGIGAGEGGSAYDINIIDSYVEARGGSNGGAGIGGGEYQRGGAICNGILIDNSTVYATGCDGGAGIGGGQNGQGENIVIKNDSYVEAHGGNDGGAGIGGGEDKEGKTITIINSEVKAWGGGHGSGIGGGEDAHGTYIYIENSDVEAYGSGEGAGIGGGGYGWGAEITIQGDKTTVLAKGGEKGAGIGGGKTSSGHTISIYNGSITAIGGENATGIGNGYDPDAKSYNIWVATTHTIKADGSNPPVSVIENNGGDISDSLNGRRYVIIERTQSSTGSLFESNNIWFFVAGIILLLVIIAIVIVIIKKKKGTATLVENVPDVSEN